MSSIADQLDPFAIAERDIRFLEVNQDEIKADHQELLDQLKSEADDEQQINTAIESLINQLNKIQQELADLDKDGLARVQNEALPAMQKQLSDINDRHNNANQTRQVIKRGWPSNDETNEMAQSLLDQIDSTSSSQQQQLIVESSQQHAVEEWLVRKDELQQQLVNVTVADLQHYADNIEVKTTINEDAQAVSNLADKLCQLRLLIQNAIDWLSSNTNLPVSTKASLLQQLNKEKSKVEEEESKLHNLLEKMPDIANQLNALEQKHDELIDQLESLRRKAQQIRANSEAKERQQSAENEWLGRKDELKQELLNIEDDLQKLLTRNADNLESSSTKNIEDDIQHSSDLMDKLRRLKQLLQNTIDWLSTNEALPENDRQSAIQQLHSTQQEINNNEAKLNALLERLPSVLSHLHELEDQHDELVDQLEYLQQKADRVRREAEEKQQTDRVRREAEDKHVQQINQQHDALFDEIEEAAKVIDDPTSTIEQLQRSTEILLTSRPKLDSISNLYNDLDEEDPQIVELKKKTADKLKSLSDLFQHQQKSADDRIQLIIQQQHDQLNALINEGQQILSNLPTSTSQFDDYNARVSPSTKSAQTLAEKLPKEDPRVFELNRLIDLARQQKQQLEHRVDKWNEFNGVQKEIVDKQAQIQNAVNDEQVKGVQSLTDTVKSVKVLEVSSLSTL